LIVDDEKNIRFTLAETLAALPLEADVAADGEEALRLLEDNRYSLMLLDLRMPGMDGIEVLRRVREIRPEIPVILLTAYGTVDVAVEAMKLGAVDFLSKPFHPADLQLVIKTVLARQNLDETKADDYGSHFELAKKCLGQRHLDAAIEHLHLAIGLAPQRPEAFNMLGAINELRHRTGEALKNYRVALDLDPTYKPAQQNLDRAVTGSTPGGPIALGELRQR
jgi:DNA-binding response OmpR family regulator